MLRRRLIYTAYPRCAKLSGKYQFVKYFDGSEFSIAMHPTAIMKANWGAYCEALRYSTPFAWVRWPDVLIPA